MARRRRTTPPPSSQVTSSHSRDHPDSPTAPTDDGFDWREHLGATVGLLATAYVAAKVLAISNYSLETAFGYLRATGAVSAGVGAMVTFVPVLAGLLWAAGMVLQYRSFRQSGPVPLWRWPALATLTTFAAAVAPIVTMLAILILGLISWTVHKTAKPGQEPVTRGIQMSLATALAVLILAPAVLSNTPWLPPERIVARGHEPFTAYVLDEDERSVTVMYEDPRQIARLDQAEVQSRTICKVEDNPFWEALGAPLWALFRAKPDYPQCPAATAPRPSP